MAGGEWSWTSKNNGVHRDSGGESQRWKCAHPDCGCAKNLSWFTWCKHCRRPRYEGDQSDAGGAKKSWQRSGGGGKAPALLGGAAMPPAVTLGEIEQLLSMATKFGDEAAKSQYLVWKKQKQDAAKGPVEKPLERQANEALQQVRILEKRLTRELDSLERAKKWLADCTKAASDAQSELDAQDQIHKDLVTRLHKAVIQPQPEHAAAPPVPGGISIRAVLDGKPDAILLTDGDELLKLDDTDYELSPQDLEEFNKRRAELQEGLASLTKDLFANMVSSIDKIRADHAAHVKRIAKKRKVVDQQEGRQAAPGSTAPSGGAGGGGAAPAPEGGGDGGGADQPEGGGAGAAPPKAPAPDVRERARAVPGGVEFLAVSAHLKDSEGLSERNIGLLSTIGALLTSRQGSFVVGADFQMEPEVLASSELVSTLPANIVYPDVAGTCAGTSTQGVRMLDYFIVSIGLAKAIRSTDLVLEAATKPHKPARIAFFPQIAQLQALGFAKPPPIPAYLDPLPFAPPEELRRVSRSYPKGTAISVDGFHMRHYAAMSDGALIVLMSMFSIMGSTTVVPHHVRSLMIALLPKQDDLARPYLAAGAFTGAADVVWRQAVRSEFATGSRGSGVACSVLWDLHKFYELVDLGLLQKRCDLLGFPAPISRLAITMYRGPRWISIGGMVQGPYFAQCGVVAGDSFATSFVRACIIPSIDLLAPSVRESLDVYIGDYGLQATGSERSVVSDILHGASQLHAVLTDDMKSIVSIEKASVVCSSQVVGSKVRDLLEGLGGVNPGTSTAVNLGVDDTAGRPRRQAGRGVKARQRLKSFKIRVAKLKREVIKVKAHVVESDSLTPLQAFLKKGNDAADIAAKAGLSLHPAPTSEQQEDLSFKISVSKAVARLGARLLPLWPKLDLSGVGLHKDPKRIQVFTSQASSKEMSLTRLSAVPSWALFAWYSQGKDRGRAVSRAAEGGSVPLENGLVVDHIGLSTDSSDCWAKVRMLRFLLGWMDHIGTEGVYSSRSRAAKKKGLLALPDYDLSTVTVKEMKMMASIAPGCTVNAIQSSKVVGKFRLTVPERIYNLPNLGGAPGGKRDGEGLLRRLRSLL
ncbi:unnamed protein product, partial [Prorocentrum cordatum]